MNSIIQLKGKLIQKKSQDRPGHSNIPKNKSINISKLKNLKADLINTKKFWQMQSLDIRPLISVYYNDVVAKSNRIKGIFESTLAKNNSLIVGAKFTEEQNKKHIITYCVSEDLIDSSINNIERAIEIISMYFSNNISFDDIDEINNNKYNKIFDNSLSKSRFVNIVVDSYYIDKFGVDCDNKDMTSNAIVTIYDTGTKTTEIMLQLGIDFLNIRSIDETTLLLTDRKSVV